MLFTTSWLFTTKMTTNLLSHFVYSHKTKTTQTYTTVTLITHADDSHVSKAFSGVCDSV